MGIQRRDRLALALVVGFLGVCVKVGMSNAWAPTALLSDSTLGGAEEVHRGRIGVEQELALGGRVKARVTQKERSLAKQGGGNPFGVLARTVGESNIGGVLARADSDASPAGVLSSLDASGSMSPKVAVFGSLAAFPSDAESTGGSLTARGVDSDDSWDNPEGLASGGVLFDRSLVGTDDAEVQATKANSAHKLHRDAMRSEAVGGSLATFDSSASETWGSLSAVAGGADKDGAGTLSLVKMSNPDGVLAVYGKTGEYVDKARARQEKAKLNTLAKIEGEALAMHEAQARRLAALKKAEAADERREDHLVRVEERRSLQKAAAIESRSEEMAAKAAAVKHAVAAAAARGVKGKSSSSLAAAKASKAQLDGGELQPGGEEQEETAAEEQKEIKKFNDVGWEKHEWNAPSWSLFFLFGPVITALCVFIVWYCAGVIPAVVMLFILLCLDIGAYYYSWFLV